MNTLIIKVVHAVVSTGRGMLLLVLSWASMNAIGTEIAPPPSPTLRVDVIVNTSSGMSFWGGDINSSSPYFFDAVVEVLDNAVQQKGDLYFGAISSDGVTAATWTSAGLASGFTPIAKDIDVGTPRRFSVSNLLGKAPQYSFIPGTPAGMYLVFALIAKAGSNPTVPDNWLAGVMRPLMVGNVMASSVLSVPDGYRLMTEDEADAVVIFTPSRTIAMAAGQTDLDLMLEGTVQLVRPLSGPDVPKQIMILASTIMGSVVEAGVPVKILLSKYPGKAAGVYMVGRPVNPERDRVE
ncbi:MAG: hypothetical protein LBF16_03550 [Pseudomonadales bacterium]|jgi:hypothetical protein|nr:hypothetical protein [Pseudomonadales bacterium]